jgi:hypothetical protein
MQSVISVGRQASDIAAVIAPALIRRGPTMNLIAQLLASDFRMSLSMAPRHPERALGARCPPICARTMSGGEKANALWVQRESE